MRGWLALLLLVAVVRAGLLHAPPGTALVYDVETSWKQGEAEAPPLSRMTVRLHAQLLCGDAANSTTMLMWLEDMQHSATELRAEHMPVSDAAMARAWLWKRSRDGRRNTLSFGGGEDELAAALKRSLTSALYVAEPPAGLPLHEGSGWATLEVDDAHDVRAAYRLAHVVGHHGNACSEQNCSARLVGDDEKPTELRLRRDAEMEDGNALVHSFMSHPGAQLEVTHGSHSLMRIRGGVVDFVDSETRVATEVWRVAAMGNMASHTAAGDNDGSDAPAEHVVTARATFRLVQRSSVPSVDARCPSSHGRIMAASLLTRNGMLADLADGAAMHSPAAASALLQMVPKELPTGPVVPPPPVASPSDGLLSLFTAVTSALRLAAPFQDVVSSIEKSAASGLDGLVLSNFEDVTAQAEAVSALAAGRFAFDTGGLERYAESTTAKLTALTTSLSSDKGIGALPDLVSKVTGVKAAMAGMLTKLHAAKGAAQSVALTASGLFKGRTELVTDEEMTTVMTPALLTARRAAAALSASMTAIDGKVDALDAELQKAKKVLRLFAGYWARRFGPRVAKAEVSLSLAAKILNAEGLLSVDDMPGASGKATPPSKAGVSFEAMVGLTAVTRKASTWLSHIALRPKIYLKGVEEGEDAVQDLDPYLYLLMVGEVPLTSDPAALAKAMMAGVMKNAVPTVINFGVETVAKLADERLRSLVTDEGSQFISAVAKPLRAAAELWASAAAAVRDSIATTDAAAERVTAAAQLLVDEAARCLTMRPDRGMADKVAARFKEHLNQLEDDASSAESKAAVQALRSVGAAILRSTKAAHALGQPLDAELSTGKWVAAFRNARLSQTGAAEFALDELAAALPKMEAVEAAIADAATKQAVVDGHERLLSSNSSLLVAAEATRAYGTVVSCGFGAVGKLQTYVTTRLMPLLQPKNAEEAAAAGPIDWKQQGTELLAIMTEAVPPLPEQLASLPAPSTLTLPPRPARCGVISDELQLLLSASGRPGIVAAIEVADSLPRLVASSMKVWGTASGVMKQVTTLVQKAKSGAAVDAGKKVLPLLRSVLDMATDLRSVVTTASGSLSHMDAALGGDQVPRPLMTALKAVDGGLDLLIRALTKMNAALDKIGASGKKQSVAIQKPAVPYNIICPVGRAMGAASQRIFYSQPGLLLFKVVHVIPVYGVPVLTELRLQGQLQFGADVGSCTIPPSSPLYAVGGKPASVALAPFVRTSLELWAKVGIGVPFGNAFVEVGLEVLGLTLAVNVQVDPDPTSFKLCWRADPWLHALSGRINVGIDFFIFSWRLQVFAWHGVRRRLPGYCAAQDSDLYDCCDDAVLPAPEETMGRLTGALADLAVPERPASLMEASDLDNSNPLADVLDCRTRVRGVWCPLPPHAQAVFAGININRIATYAWYAARTHFKAACRTEELNWMNMNAFTLVEPRVTSEEVILGTSTLLKLGLQSYAIIAADKGNRELACAVGLFSLRDHAGKLQVTKLDREAPANAAIVAKLERIQSQRLSVMKRALPPYSDYDWTTLEYVHRPELVVNASSGLPMLRMVGQPGAASDSHTPAGEEATAGSRQCFACFHHPLAFPNKWRCPVTAATARATLAGQLDAGRLELMSEEAVAAVLTARAAAARARNEMTDEDEDEDSAEDDESAVGRRLVRFVALCDEQLVGGKYRAIVTLRVRDENEMWKTVRPTAGEQQKTAVELYEAQPDGDDVEFGMVTRLADSFFEQLGLARNLGFTCYAKLPMAPQLTAAVALRPEDVPVELLTAVQTSPGAAAGSSTLKAVRSTGRCYPCSIHSGALANMHGEFDLACGRETTQRAMGIAGGFIKGMGVTVKELYARLDELAAAAMRSIFRDAFPDEVEGEQADALSQLSAAFSVSTSLDADLVSVCDERLLTVDGAPLQVKEETIYGVTLCMKRRGHGIICRDVYVTGMRLFHAVRTPGLGGDSAAGQADSFCHSWCDARWDPMLKDSSGEMNDECTENCLFQSQVLGHRGEAFCDSACAQLDEPADRGHCRDACDTAHNTTRAIPAGRAGFCQRYCNTIAHWFADADGNKECMERCEPQADNSKLNGRQLCSNVCNYHDSLLLHRGGKEVAAQCWKLCSVDLALPKRPVVAGQEGFCQSWCDALHNPYVDASGNAGCFKTCAAHAEDALPDSVFCAETCHEHMLTSTQASCRTACDKWAAEAVAREDSEKEDDDGSGGVSGGKKHKTQAQVCDGWCRKYADPTVEPSDNRKCLRECVGVAKSGKSDEDFCEPMCDYHSWYRGGADMRAECGEYCETALGVPAPEYGKQAPTTQRSFCRIGCAAESPPFVSATHDDFVDCVSKCKQVPEGSQFCQQTCGDRKLCQMRCEEHEHAMSSKQVPDQSTTYVAVYCDDLCEKSSKSDCKRCHKLVRAGYRREYFCDELCGSNSDCKTDCDGSVVPLKMSLLQTASQAASQASNVFNYMSRCSATAKRCSRALLQKKQECAQLRSADWARPATCTACKEAVLSCQRATKDDYCTSDFVSNGHRPACEEVATAHSGAAFCYHTCLKQEEGNTGTFGVSTLFPKVKNNDCVGPCDVCMTSCMRFLSLSTKGQLLTYFLPEPTSLMQHHRYYFAKQVTTERLADDTYAGECAVNGGESTGDSEHDVPTTAADEV